MENGAIDAVPSPAERVERVGRLFRRLAVVALGALAAWGAVVVRASEGGQARRDDIDAIVGDHCSYDRRADAGRQHVAEPVYKVDPPSGGQHSARASPLGFTDPAHPPPDGELVHALEHGAVVIWYRDLGEGTVEQLKELAVEDAAVIFVRRPALPVAVAATAWHRRLLCHRRDMPSLQGFVRQFRGRGPERVPL